MKKYLILSLLLLGTESFTRSFSVTFINRIPKNKLNKSFYSGSLHLSLASKNSIQKSCRIEKSVNLDFNKKTTVTIQTPKNCPSTGWTLSASGWGNPPYNSSTSGSSSVPAYNFVGTVENGKTYNINVSGSIGSDNANAMLQEQPNN